MLKVLLILLVLAPAVALAQVPQRLSYQGRLLKAGGTEPETGAKQLGFAIFDAAAGGTALWSESQTLGLTDGYYSAVLGATTPLTAAVFGGERWLEISVGGTALAPRQSIGSAPFALVANSVSGGKVSASSATVAGSVGIATGSPAARLHVVGAAAQAAGPGTVGINGSAYSTLAGTGTSFKQSGVAPGDVVVVTTTAGTSYERLVAAVVDDAALTVDTAYPDPFSGASYTIQKPVARFDTADGTPRLSVNGRGDLVASGSLRFGESGKPYPDNWIGMTNWIDGDSKWLHIGGITSTKTGDSTAYRRIAFYADRSHFSGAVGIGTMAPDTALHVPNGAHFNGITVGTAYPGFSASFPHETIALNSTYNLRVNFGSTEKFVFLNTGTATATSWSTSSDERLKTNVQPIAAPRSKALALRGVTFDWKESGQPSVGFIAQEVEKVLPEIVSTDPQGYKSVDYARLTPLLVEALKEQEAELQQRRQDIDELRSENRALERRLSKLETALDRLETAGAIHLQRP